MRAWQVTGAGAPSQVLELGERVVPEPLAGELGVEVRAAAVGLPDVFLCRGSYEFKPPRPFTPGQEVAGIVSDARHAPGFEPGQRVMGVTTFYRGNGGFAERATLVVDTVWPIPDAMSDVEAAGFPIPFRTAWLGLVTRGGLAPGETVLVHGASGGAGYAAVQLGKALGARVLAVAAGPEKCAFCREQGADLVIDRGAEDFVAAVRKATQGRGADLVYDTVGGETFLRSLDCLGTGGRLLAIGFASGAWANAPTAKLVARNLTVVGVVATAPSEAVAKEMQQRLLELHDAGRIRPVVARTFDFDDVPEALTAVEAGSAGGKIVVRVARSG